MKKVTDHRRGKELSAWRRMPRARSSRGSRHLFDRWPEIVRRIRAARHVALCLDFDGTLAPIRRRPEEVWLDGSVRLLLGRLASHPRVTVCLVSGRRLADLRRRARVPGARYIGLHGVERDLEGSPSAGKRVIISRALRHATKLVRGLPGVWVEDKGMSFAVHTRGAPRESHRGARAAVLETVERFKPRFCVLEGKKVWEVLPSEVEGKGAAVRALLAEHPASTLKIYVGDDVTDESAFTALKRGVTIRVGLPRRTRARFRLRNPLEVWEFLRRLEKEIP